MKLSFVIPSFQDIRILETIESIYKIDVPSSDCIEIIVQDAGSSNEILDKIKNKLKKNDKLFLEKDKGIFDGINKGLRNTTGDLIATLGTDDRVLALDYYELKRNYIEGYNFIQYDINYTNELWKPIRFWKAKRLSYYKYLLGMQYPHFGLICTKDIYEQVNYFNIKNKINADYEFFYYCCFIKNLNQKIINKIFVQMKIGGNSSAGLKAVLKGNISILKFILRKNPLLLLGLFLKPIYKLNEFLKA